MESASVEDAESVCADAEFSHSYLFCVVGSVGTAGLDRAHPLCKFIQGF